MLDTRVNPALKHSSQTKHITVDVMNKTTDDENPSNTNYLLPQVQPLNPHLSLVHGSILFCFAKSSFAACIDVTSSSTVMAERRESLFEGRSGFASPYF